MGEFRDEEASKSERISQLKIFLKNRINKEN